MQILSLLSDLLLICATLGMAAWCRVLSRRLQDFDSVGPRHDGTLDDLKTEVEAMKIRLDRAASEVTDRAGLVAAANAQADDRIGRMEMLLASLRDLEEETADRVMHGGTREDEAETMPSFRAARAVGTGGRS